MSQFFGGWETVESGAMKEFQWKTAFAFVRDPSRSVTGCERRRQNAPSDKFNAIDALKGDRRHEWCNVLLVFSNAEYAQNKVSYSSPFPVIIGRRGFESDKRPAIELGTSEKCRE